jgi:cyanophycin synthetase
MRLIDSRRLTGLNRHDDRPGAVACVRFDPGEDHQAAIARWRRAMQRGLDQLGWSSTLHHRQSTDPVHGPEAELMLTAEVDRLYAATELAGWAVAVASGESPDLHVVQHAAATEMAERHGLLELLERARAHDVPCLLDDEALTLGWGRHSRTWPIGELPTPDAVAWSTFRTIPVALVTGTNGKTTTSRLVARIAREAGLRTGNTSTDGIAIDGELVDPGDWTGPGAARALLRRTEIDVAILEAARGGLLRRGLEVRGCDAAIVTNVDHDHLGEYGVHDLEGLAAAKGLVTRAVRPGGRIVLGAQSPALVQWAHAQTFDAPVQWFSTDPDDPVLGRHTASGGVGWTVVDGMIVRREGGTDEAFLPVAQAPITFGGKARHNVANVLGAAAVAHALGITPEVIAAGCRAFGVDPSDNPGRARAWTLADGLDVLLDFAHNRAGLEAIVELVHALGRSSVVSFGMAGDRPDADLRELGMMIARINPRLVVLRELAAYRRGRAPGEVPALLAEGLRSTGFAPGAIHFAEDEPSALDRARELAAPGDLILLLLHSERDAVDAWLRRAGARPAAW